MTDIVRIKAIRASIDDMLDELSYLTPSRETSLARTKLEEASMWLGKQLNNLKVPNPYPYSKDPASGELVSERELRN